MGTETKNNIVIREITTIAEMRAVEELQKEVWRIPDIEVVPYTHLAAARESGGVLLGAFDGENLIGFVYGFVSFERGQTAHHSHMLAVLPEYRNYALGEKLKRAQRDFVLKQGITLISWTFDPLQSLNAYFNFNKLGVYSDKYLIDFYGDDAPSFLHRSGTDRLWVFWDLKGAAEKKIAAPEFEKVLVTVDENKKPRVADLDEVLSNERVGIEIPADINKLQTEDFDLAVQWRMATRVAFTTAFEQGYIANGFYRMSRNEKNYGVYLLERKK